jgi:hypothetical protein
VKTSDFKEVVPCFSCGKPATCFHELVAGRGVRQLAIKYHFQVAQCERCHPIYQGDHHFSMRYCFSLDINFVNVYRILKHKVEKDWTEDEKKLVIESGEKIQKQYERYK